jgi:hypothetical protein
MGGGWDDTSGGLMAHERESEKEVEKETEKGSSMVRCSELGKGNG